VHIVLGKGDVDIPSREVLLAAVASMRPPASGWDVQFVDVQVTVDSDVEARAFMTVEVRSEDARAGERSLDAREARLTLVNQNGDWIVTTAESPQSLTRP